MIEHVALVIKNSKSEILFIRRSLQKKTLPGIWSFPSGTIEQGEDPFITSIREAKEELGITINPLKIISTKELPEFNVKLIFVECILKSGAPSIIQPLEIDTFEWIKIDSFFKRFSDSEIGHGLIWLRQNPLIWKSI